MQSSSRGESNFLSGSGVTEQAIEEPRTSVAKTRIESTRVEIGFPKEFLHGLYEQIQASYWRHVQGQRHCRERHC
ncbi:unnamed protein product [Camellia sinensis]